MSDVRPFPAASPTPAIPGPGLREGRSGHGGVDRTRDATRGGRFPGRCAPDGPGAIDLSSRQQATIIPAEVHVDRGMADQVVEVAARVVRSGAISANAHGNVSLLVPEKDEM